MRYAMCEFEELLVSSDDSVGARLRLSDATLCARASSMIPGSSSVIPLRMSAKTAIMVRNSGSVRLSQEKRAHSYWARNVGPSDGGFSRPKEERRERYSRRPMARGRWRSVTICASGRGGALAGYW